MKLKNTKYRCTLCGKSTPCTIITKTDVEDPYPRIGCIYRTIGDAEWKLVKKTKRRK